MAEREYQKAYDTMLKQINPDLPSSFSGDDLAMLKTAQWQLGLTQLDQKKHPQALENLGQSIALAGSKNPKHFKQYKRAWQGAQYYASVHAKIFGSKRSTEKFIHNSITGYGSQAFPESLKRAILSEVALPNYASEPSSPLISNKRKYTGDTHDTNTRIDGSSPSRSISSTAETKSSHKAARTSRSLSESNKNLDTSAPSQRR